MKPAATPEQALAAMQTWLERAVIGLNLCPFAKGVHLKQQIRWVVSETTDATALRAELQRELEWLRNTPADETDTTLLIHPYVLGEFADYNDFLDLADETLEELGLIGVVQIASFHPDYQFAGTAPDDIDNFTNRTPHPTLHLLRESSIDRAVAAFPDAADIYERNIETLRRLGPAGWARLWV